jgi:predicted enzyme related to lactoylglutathione lyase
MPETCPRHILTILAVHDLERSAAFYKAAFGWPTSVEVPVFVQFTLPDGNELGLYQRDSFALNTGGVVPARVPEGAISGTEIYLRCTDLDEAITRLHAAQARELAPRMEKPWGDEAAYFADPEGNVLVVAAPTTSNAE